MDEVSTHQLNLLSYLEETFYDGSPAVNAPHVDGFGQGVAICGLHVVDWAKRMLKDLRNISDDLLWVANLSL